jgi:hypothetical protein
MSLGSRHRAGRKHHSTSSSFQQRAGEVKAPPGAGALPEEIAGAEQLPRRFA